MPSRAALPAQHGARVTRSTPPATPSQRPGSKRASREEENLEPLVLAGMQCGAATMENTQQVLEQPKQSGHMTQHSPLWGRSPRTLKVGSQKIRYLHTCAALFITAERRNGSKGPRTRDRGATSALARREASTLPLLLPHDEPRSEDISERSHKRTRTARFYHVGGPEQADSEAHDGEQ